jgi:hypothetical protein
VACNCPTVPGQPTDNPLCQGTTQTMARAYPGIKQLAIAKGLGDQGIPGSICAKQVTDPTAADYGYLPAVATILRRLTQAMQKPTCP